MNNNLLKRRIFIILEGGCSGSLTASLGARTVSLLGQKIAVVAKYLPKDNSFIYLFSYTFSEIFR